MDVTKINKKHQKAFDPVNWHNKFEYSQIARTDWENDYRECMKIKDGKFDYNSGIMKDVSEIIIKDNVLKKSLSFKDAMITGSKVYIDLIRLDNIYTPEQILYEHEINFTLAANEIQTDSELAKSDQTWAGLGWLRHSWNPRRINNVWKSGTPKSEYVDTRRMYIDPSSIKDTLDDIRYLFHVKTITLEDAQRMFPGKEDILETIMTEGRDEYGEEYLDSTYTQYVHIVICEYKKIEIVKKVRVTDKDTGTEEILEINSKEEYQDLIEQTNNIGDIEVSEPFEVEEDAVFECVITELSGQTLSAPRYIGNRFSYTPITGERLRDDPYPRGLAFWLKDLDIAQTILFSVSTMLTIKALKRNILIPEGALTNEQDFMENRHLLNSEVGHISAEWMLQNPGARPLNFVDENINLNPMQQVHSMLSNSMKELTGATDAATGQSRASDSGIKVAQLQSAAGISHKWDENRYHHWWRQIGTWYMNTIPENRDYDHDTMFKDSEGNKVVTSVNGKQFHPEEYRCEATIEQSPEALKQQKIDTGMQLHSMGAYSMNRLLQDIGIPNPEQIVNEARQEQGIADILRIIQENPQLAEFVQNYEQQQKAIGRDGSAGIDVSDRAGKKE